MEMSARFASITAGLLARKGEARPWTAEPEKLPLAWRHEPARPEPLAATPPPPSPPDRERSCAVRMSAQDYERLGILAVKTGSSRQQLLKQALADLLASRAQSLSCACLGSCEQNCC
jgi:hypothetical protein